MRERNVFDLVSNPNGCTGIKQASEIRNDEKRNF